jgi:hypothetical protein
MAFLRIEGLAIDTLIEDFEISDQSVESFNRTIGDSLEGVTYSDKKQISLTTPFLDPASARSIDGWVRGRRHLWTFNRVESATTKYTRFSDDGGLALSTAATSTASALFNVWGLQLNTNVFTVATALFGSEGDWTVGVYAKVPATNASYTFYCTRSVGGVLTSFAGGSTTATVRCFVITPASGFLTFRITGQDPSTGTGATLHFDNMMMAPFSFTNDMVLSSATPRYGLSSTGHTRPPFVTVFGDGLFKPDTDQNGAGEAGPMVCKAFIETVETDPVVLNGVFQYNARRLNIRLLEK